MSVTAIRSSLWVLSPKAGNNPKGNKRYDWEWKPDRCDSKPMTLSLHLDIPEWEREQQILGEFLQKTLLELCSSGCGEVDRWVVESTDPRAKFYKTGPRMGTVWTKTVFISTLVWTLTHAHSHNTHTHTYTHTQTHSLLQETHQEW